ncbi:MAG: phosphoribosylanthranilate isomerase [Verrucomicrobia bacterium]|nr:phosphoribosylanthranilate isomerase [Verrucomicrobiota bacterium]
MAVAVKICGLTTAEDAQAALAFGADYLGFILYAGSPRGISVDALAGILDAVPAIENAVGVFVNAEPDVVAAVGQMPGVVAVQLHGDEAAAPFADLTCPVWRAVRVRGATCVPSPAAWPADRYVVDADVPGQYGGTGRMADWDGARRLAVAQKVMLSGGLTPENVVDAIASVQPIGVDVSSGVEASPGRKDHAKVRAFIARARSASL